MKPQLLPIDGYNLSPSESEAGLVTCSGQWNIVKGTPFKAYTSAFLPGSLLNCDVNKPGLASWMMMDIYLTHPNWKSASPQKQSWLTAEHRYEHKTKRMTQLSHQTPCLRLMSYMVVGRNGTLG